MFRVILKTKKIKKEKKGVFFTISTLLLVLSLIAIVSIASKTTKIEQDLALDRAYELATSVEKSIIELFYAFSDVSISIIKNPDGTADVKFAEKISRKKEEWNKVFSEVMNNFKTFVESEDENVKINIADVNNKELPLTIKPHNINYSRYWGIGHIVLKVNPEEINFGSYEVTIDSGDVKISKVEAKFKAPGSFLFKVRAKDNYGNDIIKENFIDVYDKHSIQIFFVGGNLVKIDLNNMVLETWTNEEKKILVETKIDRLIEYDEKITIKLFDSIVNVNLTNLDVCKISDVVISEE